MGGLKMDTLAVAAIFVVLFILIFIMAMVIYKELWNKHKNATSGIRNYNLTMTSFAYKTSLNKQEIISAISMHNVKDEMNYTFNSEDLTIKFSRYGEPIIKYKITILEAKRFSIVQVTQTDYLQGNNDGIHLLQNPFWTQKIKAEPVPYNTYFK